MNGDRAGTAARRVLGTATSAERRRRPSPPNDVYASPWLRLVAGLIDLALMVFLVSVVLTFTYGWSYWKATSPGWFLGTGDALIVIAGPGVVCAGLWWWLQGTVGKMALSLAVVDEASGEPISVLQGLARYVGYLLSALPLGLGFLWIAFDERRRGWHDLLAGTVVLAGADMASRGRARSRDPSPEPEAEGWGADILGATFMNSPLAAVLLALRVLRKPVLAVTVAVLLLGAAGIGAFSYADALRQASPWAVTIAVALLVGHAVGLALGQRVSWLFAVAAFALLAVAGAVLGTWALMRLPGTSGWEGLAVLAFAVIGIAAGFIAGAVAIALWHARARYDEERRPRGWRVDAIGAGASLVVLGWFAIESVRTEQRCPSSQPRACAQPKSGQRASPPPTVIAPSPARSTAAASGSTQTGVPSTPPVPPSPAPIELLGPGGSSPTPPSPLREIQAAEWPEIGRRIRALMPAGCAPTDLRAEAGRVVVAGSTRDVRCVSDALRALGAAGGRPQLREVEADGQGGYRFALTVEPSGLESR